MEIRGIKMSGEKTGKEIVIKNLVATAYAVAEGPKTGTLAEEAMEKLLAAIGKASQFLKEEEIFHIISGNGKNGNGTI